MGFMVSGSFLWLFCVCRCLSCLCWYCVGVVGWFFLWWWSFWWCSVVGVRFWALGVNGCCVVGLVVVDLFFLGSFLMLFLVFILCF